MGSGGVGSPGHVSGALFGIMAGVKIAHVPYRGEAPTLTDLAHTCSDLHPMTPHRRRAVVCPGNKVLMVLGKEGWLAMARTRSTGRPASPSRRMATSDRRSLDHPVRDERQAWRFRLAG
jgi:hypothetical protein